MRCDAQKDVSTLVNPRRFPEQAVDRAGTLNRIGTRAARLALTTRREGR